MHFTNTMQLVMLLPGYKQRMQILNNF